MAAPHFVLASPATLAELVSRLPAEARAQVAWTPKRIADMATVLLTDPLLPEGVIDAAVDAYLEAARALSPAVLGTVSACSLASTKAEQAQSAEGRVSYFENQRGASALSLSAATPLETGGMD